MKPDFYGMIISKLMHGESISSIMNDYLIRNFFQKNDESSKNSRFFSKNPRQRQISFPPPTLNTQLHFLIEEENDEEDDDEAEDETSNKSSNKSTGTNSFEVIES